MDFVMAAEEAEVIAVSAGPPLTNRCCGPADESALLVNYQAVNPAATLTKCCNEAVTKLQNR